MHVFAEIYLTFQYEESTIEICSLVSTFEPSALKERAKKKKVSLLLQSFCQFG